MPTTWTEITGSSISWTDDTYEGSPWHLLGSPIGLLLALTHPYEGDNLWSGGAEPSTTWTEI